MDDTKPDDLGPELPATEPTADPLPSSAEDSRTLEAEPITGESLKTLREQLGLTQKEFAEFCGLPAGTVATWERRGTLSAPAAFLVRAVRKKTDKERKATVVAQLELSKVIANGL